MDDELWDLIDESNESAKFIHGYFDFIYRYNRRTIDIKDRESSYNHEVVWPVVNLAVDFVPGTVFRLGEILLDASDDDCKADGTVNLGGIEVLVLETSGPYGIKDDNRFGQDHVKGAFGALTFLRKILKKFYYASEDSMHQLKVMFVHARGTKLHLWTLEIPSNDIQVLEHVVCSDVPQDHTEVGKMVGLGNFVWKLKECMQQACTIINKMKAEHEDYLAMKQVIPEVLERTNLSTLVEREIQRPVKGSKYGVLLPEQLEDCHVQKKNVA